MICQIIILSDPFHTLGTRDFFSRVTRSFVGHRPTRIRHFLSLDRNQKPRMKSLWQPGYPFHGGLGQI